MKNLFLVHTPYHLLLATSIASTEYINDSRNYLIIVEDFETKKLNYTNLRKVFQEIIILKGEYNTNNKIVYWNLFDFNLNLRNICIINRLMKQGFSNLFISNDFKIIDKKAMQLADVKNDCKIIYIEDGLAAYSSNLIASNYKEYAKRWKIKSFLYNLKEYGEPVNILGLDKKIDECRVLFPNLVRDELFTKSIREIREDQFKKGILTVFGNYLREKCLLENSVVIFLEHSNSLNSSNESYTNLIQFIIKTYQKNNMKIYLKYHPRESYAYFDFIKSKNAHVMFVEKNIPSEALLYGCGNNIHIISNTSTSLLSVNKISNKIILISLMELLGNVDKNLKKVFEKFNIYIPRDTVELSEIAFQTIIKENKIRIIEEN